MLYFSDALIAELIYLIENSDFLKKSTNEPNYYHDTILPLLKQLRKEREISLKN